MTTKNLLVIILTCFALPITAQHKESASASQTIRQYLSGTDKDPLSVYMVFPYMDHDLAGLLENDRVKLSHSHIKLYMKQLLEGTEYMHRVRDFGLSF